MKLAKDFISFSGTANAVTESINFGAVAPIKPYQLPAEIASELNLRLGDEYTAHFYYVAAANWCKDKNYNKAAAFFDGEAAAELTHAQGIHDYVTSWNMLPTIAPFQTNRTFSDLIDVINGAYTMEYELLQKYSANQQMALGVHPASFNFLQTYVDYQNGEVKEYADLLNALELININNPLDVLLFEKNYF